MEKQVRLELRARNNILWHAIFDQWGSVAKFCKQFKLSQTLVGSLLNLKDSPFDKRGEYRKFCLELAACLGCIANELFPRELYQLKSVFVVRELSFCELPSPKKVLELPALVDLEQEIFDSELRDEIEHVLACLSPRKEKIIRMRFGLGCDVHTFDEIGKEFNISRARAHMVFLQAMARLRSLSRLSRLKLFIELEQD